MTATMETLDPAALANTASTVTYNPKSETVTLPGEVVSVAGVTVVTGGVELSCRSCMLAFCFWGTLIGFSCFAIGLWDQLTHTKAGTSPLLGLGFVIVALSFVGVASVTAFHFLMKEKREKTKMERQDGKEVLVEDGNMIKKVTV